MEEGEEMAGRKSLYESQVKPKLSTIEGMYREGHTLDEIADYLGIALSTLCNYKNQHPELDEALKRGNQDAVYEVENALFKSACGYYYTEQELTKSGEVVEVTKYAKPNTTSMIFWLKNRAYDKWKDRQEHDVNANVAQVIFEGEDDIKD